MLIITGPNMAGKSTYMRQNALIALMAQIGQLCAGGQLPGGRGGRHLHPGGCFRRSGRGPVHLMVEMTEVAEILQHATRDSLVILDEIGRGTSTFDGMSIARAVVEYICKKIGCKTLFATHYHELTDLEQDVPGVKNYNIAVKKRGEDITFLRRIVAGPADDSYGIEVAKLAGLPSDVTRPRPRGACASWRPPPPAPTPVCSWISRRCTITRIPRSPARWWTSCAAWTSRRSPPLEALNFLYELKQALKA